MKSKILIWLIICLFLHYLLYFYFYISMGNRTSTINATSEPTLEEGGNKSISRGVSLHSIHTPPNGQSYSNDHQSIITPVQNTNDEDDKTWQFLQTQRKRDVLIGIGLFLGALVIDIGLPLGIYYAMKPHTSIIAALLVSCIPPLLFVIAKFVYYRRVDILGCLCCFGFILAGIFALATGDPRLVLLRDSSITCVTGVCFLLTLIPIRTKRINIVPLSYLVFIQLFSGGDRIEWTDEQGMEYSVTKPDWMFAYVPWVRLYAYVSTGTWGFILVGEFIAKVIMIKSTLTIDQVVSWQNNIPNEKKLKFTWTTIVFIG